MSKLMQFVLIYLDYLHVKNYTKIRSFQTYIYITRTNYIIVFTRCVYDVGAKIERAFKIVRNPGWRVSLDRSYRECFFTSACKETSEIKWHVEW